MTNYYNQDVLIDLQAENCELRAKLAELESQKPCAWANGHGEATIYECEVEYWKNSGYEILELYAKPVPADKPSVAVPDVSAIAKKLEFAAEHLAFEDYARAERMDMGQHPLYYLFLDPETSTARDAWRSAMHYAMKAVAEFAPAPSHSQQSEE
jgi:hypothetical protein